MDASQFIAEIVANPHDLTPRLVFADWLEDEGDPRGEFIRTQCELSEPSDDHLRRDDLDDRQEELLRMNASTWAAELQDKVLSYTFRRGMIEQIEVDAAAFNKHASEILSLTPVRFLTLQDAGGQVESLVKTGVCEQLVGLTIEYSALSVDDMQQLASAAFPILQSMGLPYCHIDDELFKHFVAIDAPQLNSLDLRENTLRNVSAQLIANSPKFASIRFLDLFANEIRRTGGMALADSDHLVSIELLNIGDNPISQAASVMASLLRRYGGKLRV